MSFFGNVGKSIGTFANSATGGFLLPLAGNIISSIFSANKERKLAKENWNMMNEYNSPAAQLARYKAAGMNPSYGAGMASGNSTPIGDAASSVAHVEIPNLLGNLQQYYSTKNAVLENSRLQEVVNQEKLQTDFLSQTLLPRIHAESWKNKLLHGQASKNETEAGWMNAMDYNGQNPLIQRYQIDAGRWQNEQDMFKLTKELSQLNLNYSKLGINPTDNIFVRMLSRMFYSGQKLSDMKFLPWQN